jgi:hypothetical protein
VQSNGTYRVWANGSLIYINSSTTPFYGLTNGVAGAFANNITIGRNWPDAWTTFNGHIGDVFFYKTALSDTERESLEQYLAARLVGGAGPTCTITASAGAGGSIFPSGSVLVLSNANQTFTVTPNTGYHVLNLLVDGASKGPLSTWTFTNVTAAHSISVTFTNEGVTHKISASAGTGGTITPGGEVTVNSGDDQIFTISPSLGYTISDVLVDGVSKGAISTWTFTNVSASHTIVASFAINSSGVPRPNEILFSCVTDSFPGSGNTGPWTTFLPVSQTLSTIGTPTVDLISGVKWEKNVYSDYDGYSQGYYTAPLSCNGVTIVAAVRPVYVSVPGEPRGEIVDIFYDRLALSVSHGDGRLMVARGYWNDWGPAIADGQKTIVSLVVQPNGAYAAYINGAQVMTGGPYGNFSSIPPDHTVAWGTYTPWASNPDFTHYITVGRNLPDGWSTFNGNIGDVFVYKVALTDSERQELEARLAAKFILPPSLSISATAPGTLEIAWPDTYAGRLVSSPTLVSNVVWTPVVGTPVRNSGLFKLTVTPASNPAFYALGL